MSGVKISPHDYAQGLFTDHYMILMEYGDELSQEILISLLSKQHAIITALSLIESCGNNKKQEQFYLEVLAHLKQM